MAGWRITIEGKGQHHNTTRETEVRERDADFLAAQFVRQLQLAGHTITKAEVQQMLFGGTDDLLTPNDSAGTAPAVED